MSVFHQAETNVVAHRMSSAEEAKWRDNDVDPVLLQDPTEMTAQESWRREYERQQVVDQPVGRVVVKGMFSD